jgi:hypothetical protein
MEPKGNIYSPLAKKALVISSSKYGPGIFSPLPQAMNDGKKMRSFLEDEWEFEVDYLADKDIGKIEDKFKDLQTLAANAATYKSIALIFVYYSGHGTIRGKETYGHTIDYKPIAIESFIRKLARRANVFVIGLLDCCRIEEPTKGITLPDKPLNG